jgi:hypothetical protein
MELFPSLSKKLDYIHLKDFSNINVNGTSSKH